MARTMTVDLGDELREFIESLIESGDYRTQSEVIRESLWICPYISRHLLSLNPLLACCRRYSRGER